MHPPTDHKGLPKAESEKPSSSNTSSGSTENMPGCIGRVITRAVSTIIPSCRNQQANRVTGKPSTCNRQYNSTHASGLSSILSGPSQSVTVQPNLPSRRVACELTLPDAHFHVRKLSLGAPNTNGASSSQVTDNQQFVCAEIQPNPISRTNLLTATPTFKDARVTAPRSTRNNSRKPTFNTGASTSTDPASWNQVPTINYPHKDKGGTSTRSARKSVVPSPVSGNSKPTSRVSDVIIGKTGPILREPPLLPNSVAKVTGGSSNRVTGNSKLVNFTSDQRHSRNKVLANKSSVKVTSSDPKGKAKAAVVNQAARRKTLELQCAYKGYEQWVKDHYISFLEGDLVDSAPIPLGEKCQLCAIDLAFLSYASRAGTSTDPPVCAVLPCGHCAHASCLEQVYGSSLEPQCLFCTSSPVKSSKK